MFKKIISNVGVAEISSAIIITRESYRNASFSEYSIGNLKQILEIISRYITFSILPNNINLTEIRCSGAPPHTDIYPVVLNFYLAANSNETEFWKSDRISPACRLTSGFVKRLTLQSQSKFTATAGDVYLLNTHAIHSVNSANIPTTRQILRCIWHKRTYSEILESISTNNEIIN